MLLPLTLTVEIAVKLQWRGEKKSVERLLVYLGVDSHLGHSKKQVLIHTFLLGREILTHNFVFGYCTFCLCERQGDFDDAFFGPNELESACIHTAHTRVCVCVSGFCPAELIFFCLFSGKQTGRAEQGHCLRGISEKCSSAVGKKKYERDPKSRHRAPWIMSAAWLKKRDETICSSIWMANWLTVLLTQAEEVWRGCED